MKIGGDEWKHSWLDKNVPGRRRSNETRAQGRAANAMKRKIELNKARQTKKKD